MTQHTTRQEAITLLTALYELARANRPATLGILAGRLAWGVGRVVRVLAHLEQRGVADRARCRLTLAGLAMSVALMHGQEEERERFAHALSA